jgi:tripartite-type tricarboxylate transporter receptor subunit TctC
MAKMMLLRYVLAAALLLPCVGVAAEDYPSRPVTIVVGSSPGGVTDITTRQFAEVVSKKLGQPIVIENRTGASGAIAASAVQNARPDGHTLLMVVGAQFASLPAINRTTYDPLKGFAPITPLFRLPTILVVPYDSPAKSVADLLALGKSKPGGLLLGSPGAGTPGHLLAANISLGTATPMQYVHYRGGAPVIADLITGRIDFTLTSYNSTRSNIDAKKLRVLAVDAEKRLPALPDVPTFTEVGLGQYHVADWFGLLAPAGTPEPIIAKLHEEFADAARNPELIKKLIDNGNLIATSTPQEMQRILAEDVKSLAKLIDALGLAAK